MYSRRRSSIVNWVDQYANRFLLEKHISMIGKKNPSQIMKKGRPLFLDTATEHPADRSPNIYIPLEPIYLNDVDPLTRPETGPRDEKHPSTILATEENENLSGILNYYKYLENPITSSEITKVLFDLFLLIPIGMLIALPQLETSLLNTLGFIILNQVHQNEHEAYLVFYLLLKTLFYKTFIVSIESILTITISQAFGQTEDKSIGKRYMSQAVLLLALYTILFYIPLMLLGGPVFEMCGFSHELAHNFKILALKCLCSDILEALRSLITGYCNSQEIEGVFAILSWVNLIPSIILSLVLGVNFGMGIDGWIIGRTTFQFLNTASFLFIYFTKTDPNSRGLCAPSEVCIEFGDFACSTAGFAIGVSFEMLAAEINTIFNALSNDNHQIAAFGAMFNMLYITFDFSGGFMIAGRTRINYLLGAGFHVAAKRVTIMLLCAESFLAAFLGVIIYFMRYQIAGLFASEDPIQEGYMVKLIVLYCFFIQLDLLYGTAMMLCSCTNHMTYYNVVSFAVLLANFVTCCYLRLYTDATCVSYFSSLYACFSLALLLLAFKVLAADWSKIELLVDS